MSASEEDVNRNNNFGPIVSGAYCVDVLHILMANLLSSAQEPQPLGRYYRPFCFFLWTLFIKTVDALYQILVDEGLN